MYLICGVEATTFHVVSNGGMQRMCRHKSQQALIRKLEDKNKRVKPRCKDDHTQTQKKKGVNKQQQKVGKVRRSRTKRSREQISKKSTTNVTRGSGKEKVDFSVHTAVHHCTICTSTQHPPLAALQLKEAAETPTCLNNYARLTRKEMRTK
jgi:hypothetical protein